MESIKKMVEYKTTSIGGRSFVLTRHGGSGIVITTMGLSNHFVVHELAPLPNDADSSYIPEVMGTLALCGLHVIDGGPIASRMGIKFGQNFVYVQGAISRLVAGSIDSQGEQFVPHAAKEPEQWYKVNGIYTGPGSKLLIHPYDGEIPDEIRKFHPSLGY
jgi:hypothetical protein